MIKKLFLVIVLLIGATANEVLLNTIPAFKSMFGAFTNLTTTLTSNSVQNNLRAQSVVIESTEKLLDGYFQVASYTDGECKRNIGKQLIRANYCALYFSSHMIAFYLKVKVTILRRHVYQVDLVLYEDNKCENYLLGSVSNVSLPILTCNNQVRYHEIPYPLSFENVPNQVYLALYDSETNCGKNDPYQGMIQSVYVRKGVCFGGLNGDVVYQGCDNKGAIVGATYSSSDGSCSGAPQEWRVIPSRTCSWPGGSLGNYGFLGWFNYICH